MFKKTGKDLKFTPSEGLEAMCVRFLLKKATRPRG